MKARIEMIGLLLLAAVVVASLAFAIQDRIRNGSHDRHTVTCTPWRTSVRCG